MDELAWRRTRRRFERNAKQRYITDLNRNILGQIIPVFADYLRSPEAPLPPPGLEYVVRNIPAEELALMTTLRAYGATARGRVLAPATGSHTPRGYERGDFDPWLRYLLPPQAQ